MRSIGRAFRILALAACLTPVAGVGMAAIEGCQPTPVVAPPTATQIAQAEQLALCVWDGVTAGQTALQIATNCAGGALATIQNLIDDVTNLLAQDGGLFGVKRAPSQQEIRIIARRIYLLCKDTDEGDAAPAPLPSAAPLPVPTPTPSPAASDAGASLPDAAMGTRRHH